MAYLLPITLALLIAMSQLVTNPEDMSRAFGRAQRLLASGDFDGARQAYGEMLAVSEKALMKPSRVLVVVDGEGLQLRDAARYQLANIDRRKAKLLDKERQLGSAAEQDTLEALRRDHLERAAQGFAALRDEPGFTLRARAAYLVADSWFEAGAFTEAATACEVVLARFGDSRFVGRALYTLGWSRYELGQYEAAVAALERYVAVDGEGIQADRARLQIGLALEQLGRLEEALAAFAGLAEGYNPTAMSDREKASAALAGLRQGTSRRSIAAKAWLKRGDALRGLGRWEEAVAAYEMVETGFAQEERLAEMAWVRHGLLAQEREGAAAALAVYRRGGEVSQRPGFQGRMLAATMSLMFDAGQYTEALAAHRTYLAGFSPHSDEAGVSVDEARFRVAECLRLLAAEAAGADSIRALRRAATAAYDTLCAEHPASYLVPEALLAQGEVDLALGDTVGARAAYGWLAAMPAATELACHGRLALARLEDTVADSTFSQIAAQCADPQVRGVAVLELARRHRTAGRLASARQLLEGFEPGWPHADQARLELAQVWVQTGQYEEARRLLSAAARTLPAGPQRAQVRAQLGLIEQRVGGHAEAVRLLTAAMPDLEGGLRATARFGLGWSLLKEGQAERAWQVWTTALAAAEADGEQRRRLLRGLGLCARQLGQPERALPVYEAMVADPATRADGRLALGQFYLDAGQPEQAAEQVEGLADDGGEVALRARLLLGRALDGQGRVAEARQVLQAGRALEPAAALAAEYDYSLSSAAMALGDYGAAAAGFARARRTSPEPAMQAAARFYEAHSLLAAGRRDQAVQGFLAVGREYSGDGRAPAAVFQAAELLYADRRWAEARTTYEQVSERWPDSPEAPEALYGAAWCALEEEDEIGMRLGFLHLAEAYPEHERTRQGVLHVADFYYNGGRRTEAQGWYDRVAARWPDSGEAVTARRLASQLQEAAADSLYGTGMALFADGGFEEAGAVLRRVVAQYPGTASEAAALCNLAVTQQRLGQWRQAAETFGAAIAALQGRAEDEGEALAFAEEGQRWIMERYFGEEAVQ